MTPGANADRLNSFGEAALVGLLAELAGAGEHDRNATVNRIAYRAGRLVGAGALDGEHVTREMESAGVALGLQPAEVRSTVRSGLRAGMANPAMLLDCAPGTGRRAPARPPVVRPAPLVSAPAPRPPRAEVEALWRRCVPVTDDPEVAAWLAGRAIDPDRVELYDLARAIPRGARVARWAGCQRVPWSTHHRLVARVWGVSGAVESLHARAVEEPPEGLPKGLWPVAGSVRGLVLAEGWGRQFLATGRPPEGWGGELVVAEGLPDWLSWCVTCSDADEAAPAVLGLTAGSWTAEVAARVPDGTLLVIATDHDAAGDGYAAKVVATFQGREVEVRRWKA